MKRGKDKPTLVGDVNPSPLGDGAHALSDVFDEGLKKALGKRIAKQLNPLFKIHDVVTVESLPRTASNKIMRRRLRADYADGS